MIKQIAGRVYYGNVRAVLIYLEDCKSFDGLAYDIVVNEVELAVNNVVRAGLRGLFSNVVDSITNIIQDKYPRM